MEKIEIKSQKQVQAGVEFTVVIDGSEFTVEVDDEYYQKLTGGKQSREELVISSFRFLLKREPKESILKHFSLQVIGKHFPEYEQSIKLSILWPKAKKTEACG